MLVAQLSRRALTRLDSARVAHALGRNGYVEGRMRQLVEVLTGPRGLFWGGRQGRQTFVIAFWLMYPGLDSVAALAAESIRAMAEEPPPSEGGRWISQPQYLRCHYLLYRAARGDTAGVRAQARALVPWFVKHDWVGICPALVGALVESQEPARRDTPALDHLEALLRSGTDNAEFPSNAAVPVLARLLHRRGEYTRALAVARMRAFVWAFDSQRRVALLKEEGDLAAIVGDTAEAIEAYRRYLALRAHPDDLARPQADSVRAALEALLGARG
jgi:hypothetical protein